MTTGRVGNDAQQRRRSTPFRLAARDGTASVARHAQIASDASDLYFSLSDLDAEAARLVLLGNGANPAF